jgi:hypothetical protein
MTEERLPYGAVAVVAGIPVYTKQDLSPRTLEVRDRYGILMAVMHGVGSVSLSDAKPNQGA